MGKFFLFFVPFLLPLAVVFGGWESGAGPVSSPEFVSSPEIALGEIVGAQHSAVFALRQGVESRCAGSSGLFVLGNISKEFDRRDEMIQRTTTYCNGSIGREWVYESPQSRTHYGVMFNYSKNKNRFCGNSKQAHHASPPKSGDTSVK